MLNKVILMGRLTRDPELKHTQNNISVVSFTLAVDRGYAKPGEEKQTDFIDIVAWRQTAEFVSRYFRKGQLVAATGRLQVRKWQDNQGNNRTTYEVVADEVFFAESKRDSASYGGNSYDNYAPAPSAPSYAEEAPRAMRAEAPAAPVAPAAPSAYDAYSDDDELPF